MTPEGIMCPQGGCRYLARNEPDLSGAYRCSASVFGDPKNLLPSTKCCRRLKFCSCTTAISADFLRNRNGCQHLYGPQNAILWHRLCTDPLCQWCRQPYKPKCHTMALPLHRHLITKEFFEVAFEKRLELVYVNPLRLDFGFLVGVDDLDGRA